jgi:hypothetical protein
MWVGKRSLVLDYLCHNCYTSTSRAFARDSTVRLLDADGDEVMQSEKEKGSEFSELSDEAVKELYIREGICSHLPVVCHAVLNVARNTGSYSHWPR